MKHELAVMIWNEFISQSLNYGCKFSFKNLEDRIGEKIKEVCIHKNKSVVSGNQTKLVCNDCKKQLV